MSTANSNDAAVMNAAVTLSLGDILDDLGGISPSRVRAIPAPGSATLTDLIQSNHSTDRIYELVDGALVEKQMGWQESLLAMVVARWLGNYLEEHPLGVITGPDGLTRLFGNTVRSADVSFFSWHRLPEGKLPKTPVPDLIPDFVIEVISVGNTRSEMVRKRREYFQAGVQLVWMIDPQSRSVAIYSDVESVRVASEFELIDGGIVLPGWTIDLAKLFANLDRNSG